MLLNQHQGKPELTMIYKANILVNMIDLPDHNFLPGAAGTDLAEKGTKSFIFHIYITCVDALKKLLN